MLKFCSAAWDTVHITEEGNVSTCLCPAWNSKGYIGNLNQNTLEEICNGHDAQDMHNSILDQSLRYCRDICYRLHHLDEVSDFGLIKNYPRLPTNLNLSIDKNCTLRCASCRTSNIYSKEINQSTQRILNQLVDYYQNFNLKTRVYCDASGDLFASSAYQEFLRRDDIPECFEFCLQTNGNLVTKNMDIITKLKDKIDIVIVSFDASTSETYKDVRGGDFDIVVEGVRQMIQQGIKVSTQFVVQYRNYTEILDYVKLCKELGVSGIGLQKINYWYHMKKVWWADNQLDTNKLVDYDFLISSLKELKKDTQVNLCGGLETLLQTKAILN